MHKTKKVLLTAATLLCLTTVNVSAEEITSSSSLEIDKQIYYTKANGITMNRLNDFLPEKQELEIEVIASSNNTVEPAKNESANLFSNPIERCLTYDPGITLSENEKNGLINMGEHKLTFYCACEICCGSYANGYTATGTFATEGRTIAVDKNKIPLGSKVFIDGYGWFVAEDVGGAIKGNKIDIFKTIHQSCLNEGVKYANVYVVPKN